MFSNVVTLRVYPRSKVSVEVARDDSSVFFVVAGGLNEKNFQCARPRILNGGSTH